MPAVDPAITIEAKTQVSGERRNQNVDVLRGIAALGVALFHFTRSQYLGTSWAGNVAHLGYLGVDAFFVVSGFVIPLALARTDIAARTSSRFHSLGGFLGNRWLRLYPAFAASALLSIALWYMSKLVPGFRGGHPALTLKQLFSNATLSCELFKTEWINPVFWTLSVEAQYYIAIALCLPLLISKNRWVRLITIGAWLIAPLICPWHGSLFRYGPTFALGILLFARSNGLLSLTEIVLLALAGVGILAYEAGYPVACASGLSFLFLALARPMPWRPLLGLGAISYSLYLVHIPIGGRVINMSEHFALSFAGKLAAVAAAVAVSILAAVIFYFVIERPSHEAARRWSRRFI